MRYSLDYTTDNRPVLVVNDDVTRYAKNDKDLIKLVKKHLCRFKMVPVDGQNIYFEQGETGGEYTYSKYTKHLRYTNTDIYLDKMRAGIHAQDIIYATTDYINEAPKHPRNDDIVDFARGKILLDVGGKQYAGETVIAFTNKGYCRLHDLVSLTPTSFQYKEKVTPKTFDVQKYIDQISVTSNKNISQNAPEVNPDAKKSLKFLSGETETVRGESGTPAKALRVGGMAPVRADAHVGMRAGVVAQSLQRAIPQRRGHLSCKSTLKISVLIAFRQSAPLFRPRRHPHQSQADFL